MKKQILKYILILLTLAFSFSSWLSVSQAVNNPESSDWLIPIIWFSLVFIFFSLSIVLIKETYIVFILLAASFLASFIFIQNYWHFLPVIFSLLLAFWAIARIKNDLKLNIKIDLWKTIRRGKILLIMALSLVITSQYYFSIKDFQVTMLVPQLKPSDITNELTTKIISMFNPEIKIGEDEDMTVDEFILESQKKNTEGQNVDIDRLIDGQLGENIPQAQKDEIKEEALRNINTTENESMILLEGRKQLSEITGKELTGQEKISEVLSDMINNKITDFLGVSMDNPKDAPLIPMALAIIIFLSVLSLGMFLSPLWVLLTTLIFIILVKTKIIQVNKIPTEMEVID